jgi:hypothetical protein
MGKDKYYIRYEALVYNMHIGNELELYDHLFKTNDLTLEMENALYKNIPNSLMYNSRFISCVFPYKQKKIYITVKNIKLIEIYLDDHEINIENKDIEITITENIKKLEKHIIFTTNLHIFFPIVYIKIYNKDNYIVYKYLIDRQKPIIFRKWLPHDEGIGLIRRLNHKINIYEFNDFLSSKSNNKYRRAFQYYIDSFI